MLHFGRSSSKTSIIDWHQLLPLLEDDDRRAAIAREFPEVGSESFLRALRRTAPEVADEVLTAGRQFDAAQSLSSYPTIAVAGMLNSGKTSLVASFLSEEGRSRALRGESNVEGTHRFVLWLPKRWQQDHELWSLLLQRLAEALGQPPEMLSLDPKVAHQQYNSFSGAESLGIPLVATDEGLDKHSVALLDCPDIVSDAAFGRGAPQQRRELLRRAAPLCSAFLVVTGAESLRDTTLGDLLRMASEMMPGVPRLLAVNKVRPRLTPDAVWVNTRELVQLHRVDHVYAAYDYEIPASQPFIPKFDEADDEPTKEPFPAFFRVSENPDENPPQVISVTRDLRRLPASLDHAVLFEQFRIALQTRLQRALWNSGVPTLQAASQRDSEIVAKLRQQLLESVLDFFARRQPGGKISELRLHQSERIVRQLSQAFADAAPWYARFGMRLHSRMRRILGGANDLFRKLAPTHMAEQAAQKIKEKMKLGKQGSMLTPERLLDAITLRGEASDIFSQRSSNALLSVFGRAIDRFENEDFTGLDPDQLREAVAEVWRQMPTSKKMKAGLTPLAVILATFGAALMAPFDFGATQVLYAATFKELMLAAGLSIAGAAWGGGLTAVDVEQQAARQQLSNFLAVLLDGLGIPRWDAKRDPLTVEVNGQRIRLPAPTIAANVTPDQPWAIWHLRDDFLSELEKYVRRP